MTKKHMPTRLEDKAILAGQFARRYSYLNEPVRTQYDSNYDAFVVSGYTNAEADGQYSSRSRPYKLYVWVDNGGRCSFHRPCEMPGDENPNYL